jgi:hypothetical protein
MGKLKSLKIKNKWRPPQKQHRQLKSVKCFMITGIYFTNQRSYIVALIIKNILGVLRGTVAQVVFKKKGELCYATSKPGKRPASKEAAAVLRMSQFKTAVEIASGVNRIPILKGLWPSDPTKHLSRFQHIVGTNYKLVNGADLTGDATLTPPFGFAAVDPSLSIGANSIQFTASALGENLEIDENLE